MNYTEFLSVIEAEMSKKVGPCRQIRIQKFTKNNNTCYDGMLIIDPLINISPTIYLNPYYHRYLDGVTMEDILLDIYHTYQTFMPRQNVDTDIYMDYEKMHSRIVMKLINYERNMQMLEQVPHVHYLDLAIIFQCLVRDFTESYGTITVRKEQMEEWGVDIQRLYQDALINTPDLLPHYFCDICECLRTLCQEADMSENDYVVSEDAHMYVLSNTSKCNGASAILYPDLLPNLAERFGSDLFLLPSSVHEFLIVPAIDYDLSGQLEHYSDLVRSVNETEVSDEEFLSNHAYLYHRDSHLITMSPME